MTTPDGGTQSVASASWIRGPHRQIGVKIKSTFPLLTRVIHLIRCRIAELGRQSAGVTAISVPNERIVGWREWVAIPALNLPAIKAKIDTGARTSALHAFYLEPYTVKGVERIRFGVHPLQRRKDIVVQCDADILDRRAVTDSGGHREMRYTIETEIILHGETWPVEMTLTDRDTMQFRMLLGRTALRGRALIDPARSYRAGRMKRVDIVRAYSTNRKETSS